ncbi:hypothetical protein, conserved [Eimeria praecox]|uniref:TNase-like domain-containing protein n=1 Tax=Eimeria praecox TaxID=51316 RepID=U6G6C6_9EIME|nr:hypothetical protein, conserved [Eimeria praecox]
MVADYHIKSRSVAGEEDPSLKQQLQQQQQQQQQRQRSQQEGLQQAFEQEEEDEEVTLKKPTQQQQQQQQQKQQQQQQQQQYQPSSASSRFHRYIVGPLLLLLLLVAVLALYYGIRSPNPNTSNLTRTPQILKSPPFEGPPSNPTGGISLQETEGGPPRQDVGGPLRSREGPPPYNTPLLGPHLPIPLWRIHAAKRSTDPAWVEKELRDNTPSESSSSSSNNSSSSSNSSNNNKTSSISSNSSSNSSSSSDSSLSSSSSKDVGPPIRRRKKGSIFHSSFAAIIISRLLSSSLEGVVETKTQSKPFTCFVVIVIDGDTLRCVPVASDAEVYVHLNSEHQKTLVPISAAIDTPTEVYVHRNTPPQLELSPWPSRCSPVSACTIKVRLYGIDAPEMRKDKKRIATATATAAAIAAATAAAAATPQAAAATSEEEEYGSVHLDVGGQPLGVAAAAALSDMVLGRVVLLQPLQEDRYKRLLARVLLPSVSSEETEGAPAFSSYIYSLAQHITKLPEREARPASYKTATASTTDRGRSRISSKASINKNSNNKNEKNNTTGGAGAPKETQRSASKSPPSAGSKGGGAPSTAAKDSGGASSEGHTGGTKGGGGASKGGSSKGGGPQGASQGAPKGGASVSGTHASPSGTKALPAAAEKLAEALKTPEVKADPFEVLGLAREALQQTVGPLGAPRENAGDTEGRREVKLLHLLEERQPPLLYDVSDVMLRRGLSSLYTAKNAVYAGRKPQLRRQQQTAINNKEGIWGLSPTIRENPSVYKRRLRDREAAGGGLSKGGTNNTNTHDATGGGSTKIQRGGAPKGQTSSTRAHHRRGNDKPSSTTQ